ncbi:9136_t:CDS:2, partial [Entrophospora sp. SA101]
MAIITIAKQFDGIKFYYETQNLFRNSNSTSSHSSSSHSHSSSFSSGRNCITDLAITEFPHPMLISGDRDGILKPDSEPSEKYNNITIIELFRPPSSPKLNGGDSLTSLLTSSSSSLYSDSYLPGILLLGYTIKKHHPNHKMYLIFFPDKLSENTICQVKKIGWIPKIVERIPPPWEGVHFTFVDQFTKLQMWSFTEYDSLIYIDGDAILTNKIDHLFELVNGKTGFEFAAAPDVWNGRTTVNFNAGLMLIKPNEAVFKEIMRVHKIRGTYDIDFAEQAFLNEYFRF